MKHTPTPGPWKWAVQDYSCAILCGDGDISFKHVLSSSPCNSCQDRIKKGPDDEKVWKWGRCTTPNESDARLIAAAPDMIEALIMCYKLLFGVSWTDYPVSDEMEKIKKVIDAATDYEEERS